MLIVTLKKMIKLTVLEREEPFLQDKQVSAAVLYFLRKSFKMDHEHLL